MINRMYNPNFAKKYGLAEAIFLDNLGYWLKSQEAKEIIFWEGLRWNKMSFRGYERFFIEFSKSQIETIIANLIKKKAIIKKKYNEIVKVDATTCYDFSICIAICDKELLDYYSIIYDFSIFDNDNNNKKNQKPMSENPIKTIKREEV